MIKVCFFISGFDYSGAEIVLDRYIFKNTNIDPYFIILYDNKTVINKYINKYGKEKVFLLNMKHSKNILRFLPWIDLVKVWQKSKSIIKHIDPKILYMNNTHEMMLGQIVVKKNNIKSIAHIHDMRKSIASPIKRFWMDRSLRIYNEVITVSEATKKEWKNEKIKVIYNGIDEEYFSNHEKYKNKINRIGFIGKISERKGFDVLYNAYKNNKDLQSKELLIAYSSIEHKLNDKLDDILTMENVKGFYNMSYDEIKSFYDQIDLLVVPSKADPLPTVVIEAMARGCLVIGSDVDGIPELLGNDKLLFKVDDIKSLEEKIVEIINYDDEKIINTSKELNERCICKFIHNKKVDLVNNTITNLCT